QSDIVHTPQRRNERNALVLPHDRPAGVFNQSNGLVAVHCDNEYVSEFPGRLEISEMSDMEDVEAAIRKNDFLVFQQCRQVFECMQFHVSASTAWASSSCVTGRVPYFITTIPPA